MWKRPSICGKRNASGDEGSETKICGATRGLEWKKTSLIYLTRRRRKNWENKISLVDVPWSRYRASDLCAQRTGYCDDTDATRIKSNQNVELYDRAVLLGIVAWVCR